ncbi:MAG: Dam family site-specific DNA-(adenine-N6)-methyltransferase [Verrucomicrobiota bacterium]
MASTKGAAPTAGDRVGAGGAHDRLAPFLKWAGGKRSLLPHLLPLVPKDIGTYFEPFLGGGALFFELARLGRVRKAVLADKNEELIHCYRTLQRDVDGVVTALGRHKYDERHYYAVRDANPARLTDAARAARTVFLNRSGYNGLYRVNRAGAFNVPFGRYDRPRLVNVERLRRAAYALRGVNLRVDDFQKVVASATPEDFVYFDPPYVPVSPTANFTAYGQAGFNGEDQERLARLLRNLADTRVKTLLSNSDCRATRALYRGFPRQSVEVRRAINSVATKRGPVSELIVRSFRYPC